MAFAKSHHFGNIVQLNHGIESHYIPRPTLKQIELYREHISGNGTLGDHLKMLPTLV